MSKLIYELDEIDTRIMSELKDFQKITVEHIDKLYNSRKMRILVSDEVGLGKTLVARGTIARFAKMRKREGADLVKIVYVCSNSAIADQNLNKLRIDRNVKQESSNTSRLSMQHLNIFLQENDKELKDSYIQLIPLTPDTSFKMTCGSGKASERALMFVVLKGLDELKPYLNQLEIAMIDFATSSWKSCKEWYQEQVLKCDKLTNGKYLAYMKKNLQKELKQKSRNGITYLQSIIDMCSQIKRNGNKRVSENKPIEYLRIIFAKISLKKLEPDLVIMDEFQRFKYLLNSDPDSDIGMLACKFFNSESVRMLLLSATPYKMYSTLEEIDEKQVDEHYSEFLNVMKFLKVSEEENQKFRKIWNNYSVKLKELDFGSDVLLSAKNAAEESMYENVCRTERISSKDNADIIDTKDVETPVEVLENDIKSYVQAQNLLDEIDASYSVPVDYIKSCPYLLSFMRDYQLKRDVEKYFKKHPDCLSLVNKNTLWLKKSIIDKYGKVANNNARLEHIMHKVFTKNAELLLWVPPSKPYYAPQGKFRGIANFSKTLIFSSWEMVPRMLASLVSYEAERKTVGTLATERKDDAHYFYNEMANEESKTAKKRYPSSRLNFAVKEGKANSMALFTLMYPSKTLTEAYNPIDCLNRNLSLQDIEKEVKRSIRDKLTLLPNTKSGREDKRWYFLAPFLMDDSEYVQDWLSHADALSVYDEDSKTSKKQKGFSTHLHELRDLYGSAENGALFILGKRPSDLIDVLSDMALASPAVCLNRTYLKYSGESGFKSYLPSQIAKLFINRMNTAESTAAVELACGKKGDDDAHWMNVLTYSKHGNIQAMFDEYAHVIVSGLDKDEHLIARLHKTIADSLSIKTTPYAFDTLDRFRKRILGNKDKTVNIRTHYAVAFTKGDGKDSDTDRKKTVRNAFNSPFRPFVLASTSIGQEGLDFHNYCRRIVHWNLPSNPIDLEQREGRINRFECLAIRQNVAARYGDIEFKNDVWTEMFEQAKKTEKTEGCSDMIPFWGLKETPDMIKIERIVPMFPYSKDGEAYARLIKILSLYRLTLGQARQEELLEYIFKNVQNLNDMKKYFINLSPFYRKND